MSDVCMAYLNMMGMQWEVVAMGTPAYSNFILIIHSRLSTHLSGSVVRLQISILLSVEPCFSFWPAINSWGHYLV